MESNFKTETFRPGQLKNQSQAYTNLVFVSAAKYKEYALRTPGKPIYVEIEGKVFGVGSCNNTQDDEIALGKYTRQYLRISLTEKVRAKQWVPPKDAVSTLSHVKFEIELISSSAAKIEVSDKDIIELLQKALAGQYLHEGQYFLVDYMANALIAKVASCQIQDLGFAKPKFDSSERMGLLTNETDIEVSSSLGSLLKIKSSDMKTTNLFKSDFKFEELGIGGLNDELSNIFRRAFASRRFPPAILEKYGIKHVKGVLLFGPPGTGKTLIARQLSKALRCQEPKIVNGPEVLNKYVGEAEKNIRDLFKEAIEDQRSLGDESPLHIIIFDEIDAICKSRGTIQSGTGVHDSMVNQLLSMIDGVESLNNILVIGMTNRKDLIDEAVLRPGRFEVHIEVGLPNLEGRKEIFKIHTAKLAKNKLLGSDVSIDDLASTGRNYTGAEIEAVVKSACAFAFSRGNDLLDFSKEPKLNENCLVEFQDFKQALAEVKPQFGADNDRFEVLLRGGMFDYGPAFRSITTILQTSISQVKNGKYSQLFTVLLEGPAGTGKTALAAWTALNCNFPYVKLISPENFVGFTELGKINSIVKIFEDAYRSDFSCIILDNLERLIEYVDLGPRFSNQLLQTLLVLIKKVPKEAQNKLLILGTTSAAESLRMLDLTSSFSTILKVEPLNSQTQIYEVIKCISNQSNNEVIKISKAVKSIPIKNLLLTTEMASQFDSGLNYDTFMECFTSFMSL